MPSLAMVTPIRCRQKITCKINPTSNVQRPKDKTSGGVKLPEKGQRDPRHTSRGIARSKRPFHMGSNGVKTRAAQVYRGTAPEEGAGKAWAFVSGGEGKGEVRLTSSSWSAGSAGGARWSRWRPGPPPIDTSLGSVPSPAQSLVKGDLEALHGLLRRLRARRRRLVLELWPR